MELSGICLIRIMFKVLIKVVVMLIINFSLSVVFCGLMMMSMILLKVMMMFVNWILLICFFSMKIERMVVNGILSCRVMVIFEGVVVCRLKKIRMYCSVFIYSVILIMVFMLVGLGWSYGVRNVYNRVNCMKVKNIGGVFLNLGI